MKKISCKRGFTLIELLVVVLIIGILAAVALPQYQKAVRKSRLTQAIVFAKALHDAEEAYYLNHGEYTKEMGKLDIEATCPKELFCELALKYVNIHPNVESADKRDISILYVHTHANYTDDKAILNNKMVCAAHKDFPQAVSICQNMGGDFIDMGDDFRRYLLN